MKKIFYILLCSWCITSCVTQERCLRKFPAAIITQDSIVNSDTVIIKDTVVKVTGETIQVTTYLHDTILFFDTVIVGEKTQLHVQIAKGKLQATCTSDSLQIVIANLQKIIKSGVRFRNITQLVPKIIEQKYIPKWVWYLLVIAVVSVGWNFRKIVFTTLQKLIT